jgi:hypothetical protein
MDEIKIIPMESTEISSYQEKASLDVQIATAKHYPRDIIQAKNDSIALATMDMATAESCGYSLPRGKTTIQGPSVHLARIIAQNWGNIRVEARVIDITSTQIVSQAVCFDLQKNYAVKVEVRRSIIDKYGKKYKDDMITMTGNAGNAISFRNAVFNVIPKNVVESVFKASKDMITGDLGSECKLKEKRNGWMAYYRKTYKVTDDQILKLLKVNTIDGIKQDQIITLAGVAQSIKDGDTTIAEAFATKPDNTKSVSDKKKDLKDNKIPKQEMP